MPDGTDELGALLGELTTRAIVAPASRNRPINLYVTNYEEFIVTQDTASLSLSSTANWAWTATGSTVSLWGQCEWRSS